VNGGDVLAAAEACRQVFEPLLDRDWSVPVPGLEFTVASALRHAAAGVVWYSLDIWSGPDDVAAFDMQVRDDADNASTLHSLVNGARTCAAAIAAAPAATRGYHPAGSPDPSGFAAMACDELLVHGYDAASGLDARLQPDRQLAARVLGRLFPWHQAGDDAWATLLWANGRIELPGLPSQQGWRWHCAPLSEWNGQPPPRGS
jgi:hypothetical protein